LPVYERFEQVSLRKPENKRVRVRPAWVIIGLAAICAILAPLLAMLLSKWVATPTGPSTAPIRVSGPGGPFVTPAAPVQGHPDLEELESLEGIWNATAVTIDGEQCPAADVAKVKLTIDKEIDDFKMALPGREWSGRLWVTVKENPQRIYFIVRVDGPEKGIKLGIYEVEGDVLKICVNVARGAEEHPTDFTAEKGSQRILLELKRQEKEP